jgi:peptidoglycan/LPS O-acetylase OafA/YrhL
MKVASNTEITAEGNIPFARLDSLTSLRFFAAVLAFTYHWFIFFQPAYIGHLLRGVPVTMEYFFMLSGFVLAWSARPGDTARQFYRRRAARVYPNHILIWVILIVVLAFQDRAVNVLGSILGLVLVQTWVPVRDVYFAVNGVMWSAAVEMFFYALFPVLLPLLVKVKPQHRKPLMASGVLFLIAYAIGHQIVAPKDLYWIYLFPPLRVIEFALGILLAYEIRDGRWFRVPTGLVLTLVVLSYVVWWFVPPVTPGPSGGLAFRLWPFAIVPMMLLIGLMAMVDLENRPTFLRWKPLVVLGAWSYAFYVVHLLVLKALAPHIHVEGLIPSYLVGAILVVIVTLVSGTLHRFWERPWERRLRESRVPRADAEDTVEAT